MRIVAWNLGHQTQERRIKAGFLPAIETLAPNAVVLNEYVHGITRTALVDSLASLGLPHVMVSKRVGTNNQVLIASRWELHEGDLRGPATMEGGGESNFLHVRIPALEFELVGMRVPAYQPTELRPYWEQFVRDLRLARGRRIAFVGDFNADPDQRWHLGAPFLAGLRGDEWQVPSPAGELNFKSGSRIDHAIVAQGIPIESAAYVADVDGRRIGGSGPDTVSDHSPLVLDLGISMPRASAGSAKLSKSAQRDTADA